MKKNIWRKPVTYLVLIGICLSIIFLELIGVTILDKMNKAEYINDNITEGIIFFICIPGILTGTIGAIVCAFRKK